MYPNLSEIQVTRRYWRWLLYKYNIAHDDDKERKCVLTSLRSKLQGGTGGGSYINII